MYSGPAASSRHIPIAPPSLNNYGRHGCFSRTSDVWPVYVSFHKIASTSGTQNVNNSCRQRMSCKKDMIFNLKSMTPRNVNAFM